MTPEEKHEAILARLQEMGIDIHMPIYVLAWADAARVMVETPEFTESADFPTDFLVTTLNQIIVGLATLEWYANIKTSLKAAMEQFVVPEYVQAEDAFLEADYEDRVSGWEE